MPQTINQLRAVLGMSHELKCKGKLKGGKNALSKFDVLDEGQGLTLVEDARGKVFLVDSDNVMFQVVIMKAN